MSQKNVEVVRGAWEAFRRRDNQSVFAFYDPAVATHDHVDGSVYRGLDGVREYIRNWLSVFGDWDPQVEELIDAGDEVIAVLHERGRGSSVALWSKAVWPTSGRCETDQQALPRWRGVRRRLAAHQFGQRLLSAGWSAAADSHATGG